MNKKLAIIVIIFLLLSIFDFSNQSTPEERLCYSNLVTKLGLEGTVLNFCQTPYFSCQNGNVTQILLHQSSQNIMNSTDVACIGESVKYVQFAGWGLSENFFNFSTSNFDKIRLFSPKFINFNYPIYSKQLEVQFFFKIEEPFDLSLVANGPFKLNLELAYETNLPTANSIYINNDLNIDPINRYHAVKATFSSRNIPSMENVYSYDTFTYYITSDFDFNSFSNISTHNSISSVDLLGNPSFPLIPIEILSNLQYPAVRTPFMQSLTIAYDILPPTDFINFGASTILRMLTFKNTKKFNINGELPFSKIPKNLVTFVYVLGQLKNIPDFKIFDYTDVSRVELHSNSISGDLPSKWDDSKNNITTLFLNDNSITGTIDDSYCSLYLDIRNNKMTGKIPNCFACFFNDYTFKMMFSGNYFDNFNDPPTSCDIIPSLKFLTLSTWNGTDYNMATGLSLIGKNIGYNIYNIESNPTIPFAFVKKPNSIITASYYTPNRIIHQIIFNPSGKIFYLTPDPYPPLITSIKAQNHILTFIGSYYSYVVSDITIIIGCYSCNVKSSTFYTLQCSVDYYPSFANINNVSAIIKVGQLQTTFILNLDKNDSEEVFNHYTPCPNNCESFSGNICNYNTGTCELTSNWDENKCLIPNHNVSSFIPSNENGGLVVLKGWFGFINNDLYVTIGTLNCSIVNVTSDTISCDLIVYQNGIKWSAPDYYIYITFHNVSSVIPINENGGLLILNGWFGYINQGLLVMVDHQNCLVNSINSSSIICFLGAGTGNKIITVIQNAITWSSTSDVYIYIINHYVIDYSQQEKMVVWL